MSITSHCRESAKQEGLYSFADGPPPVGNQVVYSLWDRFLPRWREPDAQSYPKPGQRGPTAAEVMALRDAPELEMIQEGTGRNSGELDQAVIRRLVKSRKGSWYQVPARLESNESA